MSNLSLYEASSILALLLEGMSDGNDLVLGSEAVFGLNVVLRAVKISMDQSITETETKAAQ